MKEKNIDSGLLILRISISGLMLLHGVAKLIHGIDHIKGMAGVFASGVYIGEVVAPIAILVGFRTRIAAIIFAVNCVVASILGHSNEIFALNQFGGYANELLMLFLLGAVALFFSGAGKYAVSKKNIWD